MRVLKNGSGRHGNLMPAVVTPQQRASHRRIHLTVATRTTKALRPAQLLQVFPAIVIAAKSRVEFQQVARIVFHALAYYRLYAGESSGYPSRGIVSGRRRFTG